MVIKSVTGRPITVLALFFSAVLSMSHFELPERKPYLPKYQDAIQSLQEFGRSYLYMRSYEREPFYGNGKCVFTELLSFDEKEAYAVNTFGLILQKDTPRTCSAQSIVENDASEPCAAGFPESSGSAPFTKFNRTINTWAHASDGYPTPNILESSSTLGLMKCPGLVDETHSAQSKHGHKLLSQNLQPCTPHKGYKWTLKLLFLQVPSFQTQAGTYTLAPFSFACEVWSQQIDQVNELCHFVYDLLCGPEKHIVYSEEYCEGK